MSVVKELIRKENNGTLSFGNYELPKKSKLSDFNFEGDLYKVKTFKEITKLEKNEMFVYESVPGTAVMDFKAAGDIVEFKVEGFEDAQITMGLEPETEYETFVNDNSIGTMKTTLGGKLVFSVSLEKDQDIEVKVVKA